MWRRCSLFENDLTGFVVYLNPGLIDQFKFKRMKAFENRCFTITIPTICGMLYFVDH
jgi:hypothetical protein